MRKYLFLVFLFLYSYAFAIPDNTMVIAPPATDGGTIEAGDENTRNNEVSTKFNAHTHTDISRVSNTLNVGDGVAGDKTIAAYNADSNKPFLRYNDTNDNWVVSTNGVASSVVLSGGAIVFEGATDNSYHTTLSITDPTAGRLQTIQNNSGVLPLGTQGNTLFFNTSGNTNVTLPTSGLIGLPSGAIFFMITGSCPTGTTDVTATYADKFIKINATTGTSSGPILTGTVDSHTLTTTEMPAHTHTTYSGGGTGAIHYASETEGDGNLPTYSYETASTGGDGGHTHTLSSATTLEPSSITCKMCQVD